MRNQISTQTLNQDYPKTYYNYVIIDFGTVKGMSIEFYLIRTGVVSINAHYNLQFEDGSDSNTKSGDNIEE